MNVERREPHVPQQAVRCERVELRVAQSMLAEREVAQPPVGCQHPADERMRDGRYIRAWKDAQT
eukprot:364380-Chlamydomonas_euryale.AAC.1